MTILCTQDQCGALIEAYWRGEPLRCPADGTPMTYRRSDAAHGYDIRATCPQCRGDLVVDRRHDPLQEEFREWSGAEKAEIIETVVHDRLARCPVDGAPLLASLTRYPAIVSWFVKCPRCNFHFTQDLPR